MIVIFFSAFCFILPSMSFESFIEGRLCDTRLVARFIQSIYKKFHPFFLFSSFFPHWQSGDSVFHQLIHSIQLLSCFENIEWKFFFFFFSKQMAVKGLKDLDIEKCQSVLKNFEYSCFDQFIASAHDRLGAWLPQVPAVEKGWSWTDSSKIYREALLQKTRPTDVQ